METEMRASDRFFHLKIEENPIINLFTTTKIEEEIFASLGYISEIPSVGLKLFPSSSHKNKKASYLCFKSFIKQGKTFFEAASNLHYRASALMYYYSFMNLVKAYICIQDPAFNLENITHGLKSPKILGKQLIKQQLEVNTQPGIFQKFYELQTKKVLNKNQIFNINKILGYVSDVHFEYENAGFGNYRIIPCKLRIFAHGASKISWPVLAMTQNEKIQSYKKAKQDFNIYFEPIKPDPSIIHVSFDITGPSLSGFKFFQSKNTYSWNIDGMIDFSIIRKDLLSVYGNFYQSQDYNDDYDFSFTLPLSINDQIAMNEPLAIYLGMFFIGSLVRYNPTYLETLLNSKDAWIIERFVKSAPQTFLRYIGNFILKMNYIYEIR